MDPGYQALLIAVVFASQIFVLSFFVPMRWQQYHLQLFKRYPREEYPRLHPLPREEVERKLALFKPMHLAIGAGADFVSPLRIGLGLAAAALAAGSAVAVYLYRPDTLGLFVTGLGGGGMLVAMILTLLGIGNATVSRADPYMSDADTLRVRQRNYRGLFVGGTGFCLFLAFLVLYNAQLITFEPAYPPVAFSLLFQLQGFALVSRQHRDLNTRDFSVYRADSSAPRTAG